MLHSWLLHVKQTAKSWVVDTDEKGGAHSWAFDSPCSCSFHPLLLQTESDAFAMRTWLEKYTVNSSLKLSTCLWV